MPDANLPRLSLPGDGAKYRRSLTWLLLVALLALVGLNSFFTIDAGERGVVLRFGALHREAEPGLGFLIPGVDKVVRITTQTRSVVYSGVPTFSRDQQSADIDVSVIYHVQPEDVARLYREYGSLEAAVERQLDRRLPRAMKEVFGTFTAASAIQERARLGVEVDKALRAVVDPPLVIDSVQMERISFSQAYRKSVEDRMLAEVEVLKVNQNAQREKIQAEIAVIQAKAAADASVAKAEAEAKAIRLKGEAEAAAIEARAKALSANPLMVSLIAAERWNGQLPQTMVPGGALPFVTVK